MLLDFVQTLREVSQSIVKAIFSSGLVESPAQAVRHFHAMNEFCASASSHVDFEVDMKVL